MYGHPRSTPTRGNEGARSLLGVPSLPRDGNGTKMPHKGNGRGIGSSSRNLTRENTFLSTKNQHRQFEALRPRDLMSKSPGLRNQPVHVKAGPEVSGGAGGLASNKSPAWEEARRQVLQMEVACNQKRKDSSLEANKARQKTQQDIRAQIRELEAQRAQPDVIQLWKEFLTRQENEEKWIATFPNDESSD